MLSFHKFVFSHVFGGGRGGIARHWSVKTKVPCILNVSKLRLQYTVYVIYKFSAGKIARLF